MADQGVIKSDHLKRVELLKEISQLKIKIQNHEKEKSTHMYNKHSEFHADFTFLQEMDLKMAQERKSEKEKLKKQLTVIRDKVIKFQRELQNIKPTPEMVEKLKLIMEDIEGKINGFKDQQRQLYEETMKDERITSQEIVAIEKKIELWSQQSHNMGVGGGRSKPSVGTSNRDVTKDLPPEVAAFERFVEQSGGVRAEWDEYDHSAFLKYRVKHKGRPTFIRELIPALPTRNEHEIIEHERWYQQYLHLNEDKKEAIIKWKEKREVEKQTILANAGDNNGNDEESSKMNEKSNETTEQEKIERKIMLNKWRIDKELQKAEEEEMRLKQQLDKSKKRQEIILKQEQNKLKVEEYKLQKATEKQLQQNEIIFKERIETQIKAQNAKENIVKFQSRDIATLQTRISKEKQRNIEESEKQERLRRLKSRVEANVERDPSRLLQPTAGWRERQKHADTAGEGGPLLHMPHKAVPNWRQGML